MLPKEENIANAHLIAAAPELLEALKRAANALEAFEAYSEDMREVGRGLSINLATGGESFTPTADARAAIARAEGRE
jgi:hypothetical protein